MYPHIRGRQYKGVVESMCASDTLVMNPNSATFLIV